MLMGWFVFVASWLVFVAGLVGFGFCCWDGWSLLLGRFVFVAGMVCFCCGGGWFLLLGWFVFVAGLVCFSC